MTVFFRNSLRQQDKPAGQLATRAQRGRRKQQYDVGAAEAGFRAPVPINGVRTVEWATQKVQNDDYVHGELVHRLSTWTLCSRSAAKLASACDPCGAQSDLIISN